MTHSDSSRHSSLTVSENSFNFELKLSVFTEMARWRLCKRLFDFDDFFRFSLDETFQNWDFVDFWVLTIPVDREI